MQVVVVVIVRMAKRELMGGEESESEREANMKKIRNEI